MVRSSQSRISRCTLWSGLAAFLALTIGFVAFKLQHRKSSCSPVSYLLSSGAIRSRVFSEQSNRILKGQDGADQPNVLKPDGIVGSVSRSSLPSLATRIDVTVPQTIWQTARSRENTPELGTSLFNSWTTQNPGWDHYFMDDEDVEAFVAVHYNDTVLQTFKEMPLGVMRADVFRYMLIHLYGGVYADMDTECHQPAQRWAPHGCQFAVALEDNDGFFCQWAFAAVPGHGALGSVLDLVLRKMINRAYKDVKSDDEHFVHGLTGPAIFTDGILDYLAVDRERHGNLSVLYNELGDKLRKQGVCLLTAREFDSMLSNLHGHAHPDLLKGSWKSWTTERDAVLSKAEGGRDEDQEGEQQGEEHQGEEQQAEGQQGEDQQAEEQREDDLTEERSEGDQQEGEQQDVEQSEGEQQEGEQQDVQQSEGEQQEEEQQDEDQSEDEQQEDKQQEEEQSEGEQQDDKQQDEEQSEGEQQEDKQHDEEQSEGQQQEGESREEELRDEEQAKEEEPQEEESPGDDQQEEKE